MESRYRLMVQKLEEMHPGWELDIRPPPSGPISGAARQARGSGLIRYTFSTDEENPYLEFYSFHRIWGDLHARIYASGEVERLAVLETMLEVTGDPVKDDEHREQQNQRNRVLIEELEAAGLLSGGPVPNAFVINASLVTGIVTPEKPDDEGPPA